MRHIQNAREIQARTDQEINEKLKDGYRYRKQNKLAVLVKDHFYTPE